MKSDDGIMFEYRLKRLYFYMGYFTRRGVTLTPIFGPGEIIIADVDVLGIKFLEGFNPYLVIGECKSGKNVGTVDRLLWMRGLREHLKANETFVAKPKFTHRSNELARSWGILAIDEERIGELENAWIFDANLWLGSHDYHYFYQKHRQLYSTVIRKDDLLHNSFLFARSHFWYMENHIRLKRTITYINDLALDYVGDWKQDSRAYTQRWLILELIILFCISLLHLCHQCYSFSKRDRKYYIEQILTSGLIPVDEIKKVRKAALKYVYEKVKELTGQAPLMKLEADEIPPPDYSEALVDNIERLLARETESLQIPRFLDFLIYEVGLKGEKVNQAAILSLLNGNLELVLKLAKNLMFFLVDNTQLQQNQIEELFSWELPE